MTQSAETKRRGQCLCGGVAFEIAVPRPSYHVCHCGMCRRWGGGPWMSVICPGPATFISDATLAWYRGSKWAERGHCTKCGSSLFFRLAAKPDAVTAISVDAFDEASDFTLGRHIYVDAQPARYAFADDCPRLTEAEFQAEMRG